jgi:ParB-like chromosome segregation protein Spo0J
VTVLVEPRLEPSSFLTLSHDVAGEANVSHVKPGLLQSECDRTAANPAGVAPGAEVCTREVVAVPVFSLWPGESPRLEGEDKAHIARLAESETPLPPILVDRRSMRVIDGMHRFMAATLKGQETIDVVFFDGSADDAFLRAVEANVTHGLPLSHADRSAAAARIIASHSHMSDRAIAESVGLAAKTVAAIRRRSTDAVPQLNARVGRDGRVRPLSSVEGRLRAAELLAEHPRASLREVARGAGVSPATARDVRRRLERGEEPAPARGGLGGGFGESAAPGRAGQRARRTVRVVQPAPAFVLEKLLRDPSLRHNEQGRRLLRLLQHNAAGAQERSAVIAAVPPHCAVLVMQLARQYSQMWLDFAQELNERARIAEPWGSRRADGGK